jgi:MFS family permease
MLGRLRRSLTPDLRPLRESRDYRLLITGAIVTGLGTQASLVALPYQVYVTTHEPVLVGLLGIVEIVPLAAASLFGGALADRYDRRRLLLLYQLALVGVAGGLAAASFIGTPPLWLLYLLAGALAGAGQLERVSRAAIVPNVVRPEHLRAGLSTMFGMMQLTMVVGPAVGGLLIAAFDVQAAYTVDAVSCLGMALAAAAMSPQPPIGAEEHEPVLRSIAAGLRFVGGERALLGSFAIDILAMTFGMPRALFPVMSITLYHAGATGTGILFAAVSVGATVAALTTGWLTHARYLGRIVIGAVTVWGFAIAAAGVMPSIALAALLLAVAGAADSVSAVCRSTISQTLTPDHMRGRMSSVFSLVVAGGPRLGDVESGGVASLATTRISVTSGGLACVAGVALIMVAFPELAAYDGDAVEAGLVGATAS